MRFASIALKWSQGTCSRQGFSFRRSAKAMTPNSIHYRPPSHQSSIFRHILNSLSYLLWYTCVFVIEPVLDSNTKKISSRWIATEVNGHWSRTTFCYNCLLLLLLFAHFALIFPFFILIANFVFSANVKVEASIPLSRIFLAVPPIYLMRMVWVRKRYVRRWAVCCTTCFRLLCFYACKLQMDDLSW